MSYEQSFSYEDAETKKETTAEAGDDIWSSMLSNVASSKRLPQKTILVLGGQPEDQREFVEALGAGAKKNVDKRPPVANEYALGYSYLDVLDSDHEDVVTRLGLYMVSTPTPSFKPLLTPLFTPQALPETLLVILLDWENPWDWLRQIRTWVRLLRDIFLDLDVKSRETLDEVMKAWEARPRNFTDPSGNVPPSTGTSAIPEVNIPLGQGELDEPIGLPLCVVCQHADKIELLERERGWKEEEFDFVLQFLRTILLKHGASLIYTSTSSPSFLQPLIHNLLSVPSPTRVSLKHNVIERDKVLIPPSWDSWGKIRVLRDFDVEHVGTGWSVDIQPPETEDELDDDVEGGAVEVYEDVIKDSRKGDSSGAVAPVRPKGALEVPPVDTQDFLAGQMEIMDAKREEERAAMPVGGGGKNAMGMGGGTEGDSRIRDQVGPVQFNVGGIHVDADDMLRRLKDREATPTLDSQTGTPHGATSPTAASTPGAVGADGKSQNEVLAQFFSSLMNKKGAKGGGGSVGKSGLGSSPSSNV